MSSFKKGRLKVKLIGQMWNYLASIKVVSKGEIGGEIELIMEKKVDIFEDSYGSVKSERRGSYVELSLGLVTHARCWCS